MIITCKKPVTSYEKLPLYILNEFYKLCRLVLCSFFLPFVRYGEIVNINLVRDKDTGKSKGFAFVCYEDQRSTILAVDNLNGAKV